MQVDFKQNYFELFGLPIVPVPLLHGGGTSLGFRCGPVAYLTDCNAIPDSSFARLDGLQLLIIEYGDTHIDTLVQLLHLTSSVEVEFYHLCAQRLG